MEHLLSPILRILLSLLVQRLHSHHPRGKSPVSKHYPQWFYFLSTFEHFNGSETIRVIIDDLGNKDGAAQTLRKNH